MRSLILSLAIAYAVTASASADNIQDRLGAVGTKMQKIVDDSSRDIGDTKYASEFSARQVFSHAVIVANLHSRYFLTLLVILEGTETAADKDRVRGLIGLWAPTFRTAAVAGLDFIRAQRDQSYSGPFHEQMKEGQSALREMISILDTDISKLLAK